MFRILCPYSAWPSTQSSLVGKYDSDLERRLHCNSNLDDDGSSTSLFHLRMLSVTPWLLLGPAASVSRVLGGTSNDEAERQTIFRHSFFIVTPHVEQTTPDTHTLARSVNNNNSASASTQTTHTARGPRITIGKQLHLELRLRRTGFSLFFPFGFFPQNIHHTFSQPPLKN